MKKMPRILFVGIFLFALFAFPILTLLKPQAQVSLYEQRTLASIPTISKQKVWDGTYFNEWETTLSDHILLRNTMLKFYTEGETSYFLWLFLLEFRLSFRSSKNGSSKLWEIE